MSLYQCFFTLPSVRVGNVCKLLARTTLHDHHQQTLAISAQLLPASRICFSRSSSAGVHGVFVLLFLAGGGLAPESSAGGGAAAAGAGGAGAPVCGGGT